MKRILFIILLVSMTLGVSHSAEGRTVCWDAPTHNTDGSPIVMPLKYRLYCATTPDGHPATPDGTGYLVPPGVLCADSDEACGLMANPFVTGTASNPYNESKYSNVIQCTSTPNPPGFLRCSQ